MQPLYTEQEFKKAKSRQLLPLRCHHCSNEFYLPKHGIQRALNPNSQKTGDYCSRSCNAQHRNPSIDVVCDQCHNTFQKRPCDIKTTKHNFCSHSCAAKYSNAHKIKGTRVSKLEVWLSKQLPILYPDLEFHFNRKDIINSELDIYIPSLKLAFELNGIFHYEPIFSKEKLDKIQNNDNRKILACAERGIGLCIIDVSHQKYFKEQSSMKFLDIIKNIIDLKLSGSSPVISDCLASTT